ncbi:unnamed protein product [Staurois parvus]|uniref:Uncharacterized protein n=1 Tax=Staurois parvus TaxID=386267 RepID=A0ABN9AWD4_9NEOB|nr:unnamed protein product [Staurois parvus]
MGHYSSSPMTPMMGHSSSPTHTNDEALFLPPLTPTMRHYSSSTLTPMMRHCSSPTDTNVMMGHHHWCQWEE